MYLHVDVKNLVALALYARAGYKVVAADDPKYEEFTRSLNLHDGATKGRNHFLLCKDLRQPTWMPDMGLETSQRGTLGFEVAVQ